MIFSTRTLSTQSTNWGGDKLALMAWSLIYFFSSMNVAYAQPQRSPIVTGPQKLPILAALPARDDTGFYAVRDVPHGTVEQSIYKDVAGKDKRMHVYLPPGYQDGKSTYPVLYLNHGGGDDDARWSATDRNGGHAQLILDNLIAAKLAKPMIVVMPNTRGLAAFHSPAPGQPDACAREYLECILPHVEKTYRARSDRDSRALAGLSMGGFVVLNTGIPNLDKFSELYVYSSGYIEDDARAAIRENFAELLNDPQANKRFNVPLYFAAGETDIALNNNFKTMAIFNAAGIRTFSVLSDGGHDWPNWRRYLWQTVQIMFAGSKDPQPANDSVTIQSAPAGRGTSSAQPSRPPQLDSPEVHADRTVTFRMRAPNAKQVELNGQFVQGNQPLTKDDSGVWSITLGPIAPNIYPYTFVVDGVSVADPSNIALFPNERFKNSLVDVRGDLPAWHDNQDVPHGKVEYAFYRSKTLGTSRPLLVYTPPGYVENQSSYPVLYLVSGTTDTEETWFKVGRANFILDNLIAQQKAVPMIIVMPYGNMMMPAPNPMSPAAAEMYKRFSEELTVDIVPFVESNYRVKTDRDSRAVAGFSRGGGQSLFTGFAHFDKFAWIGSYSAYLTPEVFDTHFAELTAKPDDTNAMLKLLWLGVGKDDFLYEPAIKFDEYLKEKKIIHQSLVTGGGHTWMNARHYLLETLQLYFK